MALSNIFREPRREITETVIGLAVVAGPLWVDYKFASEVAQMKDGPPIIIGMMICALIMVLACMVVAGVSVFIHYIGEEVCDFLARRGLELRPTVRR